MGVAAGLKHTRDVSAASKKEHQKLQRLEGQLTLLEEEKRKHKDAANDLQVRLAEEHQKLETATAKMRQRLKDNLAAKVRNKETIAKLNGAS